MKSLETSSEFPVKLPAPGELETGTGKKPPLKVGFSSSSSNPLEIRPPLFEFDEPPEIGTELVLYDQAYALIGTTPYVRKSDGQPSALLVWSSRCAACGNGFTVSSTLRATKGLSRRCADHKAPGRRVGPDFEGRRIGERP